MSFVLHLFYFSLIKLVFGAQAMVGVQQLSLFINNGAAQGSQLELYSTVLIKIVFHQLQGKSYLIIF